MPDEPPATDACGRSVSPIARSMVDVGHAERVRGDLRQHVHVPVPRSAAPISTPVAPVGRSRTVAVDPGIL